MYICSWKLYAVFLMWIAKFANNITSILHVFYWNDGDFTTEIPAANDKIHSFFSDLDFGKRFGIKIKILL